MKKIICMLAMALLVIGAAQAQEQVGRMVVRMNDGKMKIFRTADIEEITFKTTATSPSTVEEAKAMLVGYWKWEFNESPQESMDSDIEALYYVVTEDYKSYFVFKFAETATDEEHADLAGKYVVEPSFSGEVIVNSEDPTTGYIFLDDHENWGYWLSFKNLEDDSFEGQWVEKGHDGIYPEDVTFYRVEPFEYILLDYGLKIK